MPAASHSPAGRRSARRRVAAARDALLRIPRPLALLLVVAAVHGTAWSVATAPLQGPDEIAHVAYAQQLATTGEGPNKNTGTGTQSTALNTLMTQLNLSPILGHLEGRPFWQRADEVEEAASGQPDDNASGPNSAGNYPPLYYAYVGAAYLVSPDRSPLARLQAMRLATVLLFVGVVGLAWLVAAELFAAAWARTLTTSLVALQPKLGFMAGVVNPDIMLVLVATATLLVALRLFQRGPTLGRALGIGVLAGIAAFTHARGLFLPPFAAIALGVSALRWRPARAPLLRMSAVLLAPLAVGVLAAVLWTRAHAAGVAFGSGSPVAAFNVREFVSYLWQFYLPKLSFMDPMIGPPYGYKQVYIDTFFGTFGSLEVNYRLWTYDLLQVGAATGLLALWTAVAVRWRAVLVHWGVVVLGATFFAGLMALLHLVSYGALRGGGSDPVITGRYLLPAVTLYAGAITFVVASLPRRLRGPVAGGLVMCFALLCLTGIGLSLERFDG